MYERARVDMITNQADKQKLWEVMKSWWGQGPLAPAPKSATA